MVLRRRGGATFARRRVLAQVRGLQMMQRSFPLAVVFTVGVALAPDLARATPPPKPVSDMIAAAAGDPAALKAVVEAAKKTNPDSVAEIDAQVAALAEHAQADKEARMASQGFFEGWTGEGQVGGSISTGNTSERGLALGLGFAKESLRWRHTIDLAADYQKTEGEVTKERYFAGYTGAYKFSDRIYVIGILSAEKDKFAGFKSRFTEGLGIGYQVIDRPDLKFSLEAGPALRQTNYYFAKDEDSLAGRVAGDLAWNITPDTVFTEHASGYFASDTNTITSITAITTKLMGNLSGRASYEIRYETDPPLGREDTDTTTRLTAVYSF
jgi:putative salt-induced outer membrane protein